MKQSILYLSIFALGIIIAVTQNITTDILNEHLSKILLLLLLLFVGIQIGLNKSIRHYIKRLKWKIVMVPLATTIGTFAGVSIVSFFLQNRSVTDCLSIGAGFAYYSLSSIIITESKGVELGTLALLSNIIREFFVLIFAPLMVKYFGKLAPISAGGATTMDTTLPIIAKYSGNEYVAISVLHGLIIDMSVPIWVTIFINI
ncbi:MAG: lysine exporter LysO family protein [Fermentimonas sp.]|jgi:uncharacterized membrane protein YbjE (DUF340 family)